MYVLLHSYGSYKYFTYEFTPKTGIFVGTAYGTLYQPNINFHCILQVYNTGISACTLFLIFDGIS
jgi:hypothetical protein